jgi:hypothetical protein
MNNLLDNELNDKKKKSIAYLTFLVVEFIIISTTVLNFCRSCYNSKFYMDYIESLIIPHSIALFIALLGFLTGKGKVRNTLLFLFVLVNVYVLFWNVFIGLLCNFSGGKIGG